MILLELDDLCKRNPDHLVQFRNLCFMVNNSFMAGIGRFRNVFTAYGRARAGAERDNRRRAWLTVSRQCMAGSSKLVGAHVTQRPRSSPMPSQCLSMISARYAQWSGSSAATRSHVFSSAASGPVRAKRHLPSFVTPSRKEWPIGSSMKSLPGCALGAETIQRYCCCWAADCSVHAGERFAADGANQNRLRKVSKAPPLPLVSAGRRTPQLRAVNGLPTIRLASWHPAGHRAECAPVLAAVLAGSGMRPHPGRTNGWDAGMSEDREPRWLTYKAAARLLNMSPESLRARARREHWRKTMGNDGKALVLVPTDTAAIPAATQEDEPPASRPDNRPHPGRSDPALLARIAELEVRLAAMQAELMERTQRLGAAEGELELLRPELERTRGETERERGERVVERERADRLAGDVAELARKLAALVERVPPPSSSNRPPSVPLRTPRRSWWPWRRAG